jgi:NAD(P)-dependent dehydrogenase (short-subunit alcohol dehydrogenase family)
MTAAPQQRIALVTGGATGIGRAVCERLARDRVGTVLINYAHSEGAAHELAAALREGGTTAVPLHADISNQVAVEDMFGRVRDEFGGLDYLVNNAGATELIPFPDLAAVTSDTWARLLGTNLLGAFWCSRAAAPLLRERGGAIVNVASISGERAVGSSIPYGVSKAGVLQLTRSLAVALAPQIRVNSVSAGTVRSGWHEKLIGEEAFAARSQQEASVVPLGRLAVPDDIAAGVAAMLALDFVSGQDLLVDGGKSLLY